MARRRRTGSGNFARGAFASFWILLGCLSGLYLFNVLTDPTLGGQVFKLTPAPTGETANARVEAMRAPVTGRPSSAFSNKTTPRVPLDVFTRPP